jgi:hypothetical protein
MAKQSAQAQLAQVAAENGWTVRPVTDVAESGNVVDYVRNGVRIEVEYSARGAVVASAYQLPNNTLPSESLSVRDAGKREAIAGWMADGPAPAVPPTAPATPADAMDAQRAHIVVRSGDTAIAGTYTDSERDTDDIAMELADAVGTWHVARGARPLIWTAPSKLSESDQCDPAASDSWESVYLSARDLLGYARNYTLDIHTPRVSITMHIPDCEFCTNHAIVSAWQNFRDAELSDVSAQDVEAIRAEALTYSGQIGARYDDWVDLGRCRRCAGVARGNRDESYDYALGRVVQTHRDNAPAEVRDAAARVAHATAGNPYAPNPSEEALRLNRAISGSDSRCAACGEAADAGYGCCEGLHSTMARVAVARWLSAEQMYRDEQAEARKIGGDEYASSGWACVDCLMLLANGEVPGDWTEDAVAEWLARIEQTTA